MKEGQIPKPTLVTNPAHDRAFAEFAAELVLDDSQSVHDFVGRLRLRYPQATVHARELSGEPVAVWYVYRDGHWTPSESRRR